MPRLSLAGTLPPPALTNVNRRADETQQDVGNERTAPRGGRRVRVDFLIEIHNSNERRRPRRTARRPRPKLAMAGS